MSEELTTEFTEDLIEICHTKTPIASVIWLHGLGADGNDFVPIVEMLKMPNVRFILPHAPYRNVTINNGYKMRAWYDLYGLNAESKEDQLGITATQRQIETLIAKENKRGVASNKVFLAGFSQGGAVALHTGLRYTKKLAGVIALSTYLPLKTSFSLEKSQANLSMPIFMAHGIYDDVISLDTCKTSLSFIKSEGFKVVWHEYPIAHTLSMDEVDDIQTFLLQVLT